MAESATSPTPQVTFCVQGVAPHSWGNFIQPLRRQVGISDQVDRRFRPKWIKTSFDRASSASTLSQSVARAEISGEGDRSRRATHGTASRPWLPSSSWHRLQVENLDSAEAVISGALEVCSPTLSFSQEVHNVVRQAFTPHDDRPAGGIHGDGFTGDSSDRLADIHRSGATASDHPERLTWIHLPLRQAVTRKGNRGRFRSAVVFRNQGQVPEHGVDVGGLVRPP